MDRKHKVGVVALSLALVSGSAAAGDVSSSGPPGSTSYLFCIATLAPRAVPDRPATRAVTYFSAAFAAEVQNLNTVSAAFLKFLEGKYGFRPQPDLPQPVACTSAPSLDEAQSLERTRLRKAEVAGAQIIETGWTYTPDGSR